MAIDDLTERFTKLRIMADEIFFSRGSSRPKDI